MNWLDRLSPQGAPLLWRYVRSVGLLIVWFALSYASQALTAGQLDGTLGTAVSAALSGAVAVAMKALREKGYDPESAIPQMVSWIPL